MGDFPRSGIRNKQVSDIESGYRIFINCSNLRKVIHTKLDFHWAQIAFNFLEENYAICSHPPSQIYVVWMKLPCRGKYFFRNLWSSRIALRFTVSEWTQSRDWLSSSPGSCGLGKGEGASGTIRMFAAALIPTYPKVGLIQSCSRILVLTGAGVSVSCGIPDFRSKDGVYAR